MDHFAVFGLPRRLGLDAEALRRRFYELSRRHHPDFHATGDAGARAAAEAASAELNAAYRALRDPVSRVAYLVSLEDPGGEGAARGSAAPASPAAPASVVAEMFALQEALADARAGGLDASGRAGLVAELARLRERKDALRRELAGPLGVAWDAAEPAGRPAVLARCRAALAERAYLRTVIDDLEAALGAGEPHGPTRRH